MWLRFGRHWRDETLVALLDGELDGATSAAASQHLTGCVRCTGRLDRQRTANAALAALVTEPESEAEAVSQVRPRRGVALAGAGVVLGSAGAILVAGVLLYQRSHRATAVIR
jgi:anti-sigma factor RsiW